MLANFKIRSLEELKMMRAEEYTGLSDDCFEEMLVAKTQKKLDDSTSAVYDDNTMKTKLKSSQLVYSEHGEDECFEYKSDEVSGRVPDGVAVGYVSMSPDGKEELNLFSDIKYSEYDHQYWDNWDIEHDVNRIVEG